MSVKGDTEHTEWSPRKWIIPPGLIPTFKRFDMRCNLMIERFKESCGRPLIIHGPTGVGKSMFTEYFVYKFRLATGKMKVKFLNCAAIPNTLLESELFGYKKGAHSSATDDKIGFFESAEDGVIVLEEIGEMEKQLQAKLLLAIEHKIFFKIGDTKEITLKAQVIATTNAERDKFRDDLWYRFDMFSVPPIHERRIDVLYYINAFDKELIKILSKGAVVSLMAYNWPGNVREIERVCNSIRENIEITRLEQAEIESTLSCKFEGDMSKDLGIIMKIESKDSDLVFDKFKKLAIKMIKLHIDVDKLEDVIASNGLSFNTFTSLFFDNDLSYYYSMDYIDEGRCFKKDVDLKFNLAFNGLLVLCKLFSQDPQGDYDLLDLENFSIDLKPSEETSSAPYLGPNQEFGSIFDCTQVKDDVQRNNLILLFNGFCSYIYESTIDDIRNWPKHYKEALVESLKFFTGIDSISIEDVDDILSFFKKNYNNKFIQKLLGCGVESEPEQAEEHPIEEIHVDDLKALYYETVCNKIGTERGYQKKLAKIAGKSEGTISQDLDRLGLNEKFEKLKIAPRKRMVFLR